VLLTQRPGRSAPSVCRLADGLLGWEVGPRKWGLEHVGKWGLEHVNRKKKRKVIRYIYIYAVSLAHRVVVVWGEIQPLGRGGPRGQGYPSPSPPSRSVCAAVSSSAVRNSGSLRASHARAQAPRAPVTANQSPHFGKGSSRANGKWNRKEWRSVKYWIAPHLCWILTQSMLNVWHQSVGGGGAGSQELWFATRGHAPAPLTLWVRGHFPDCVCLRISEEFEGVENCWACWGPRGR